jgi:hypothetical protein
VIRFVFILCVFIFACTTRGTKDVAGADSTTDTTELTDNDSISYSSGASLRVLLRIFHHGSVDLASGDIKLNPGKDTVHFFKRKYSENFRVYRMRFDPARYKLKSVTLTGFNRKQKLYTSNPRVRDQESGAEFMDEHISLREDHIRLEALFESLETKTDSLCQLLLVLDRELR